MISGVFASMLLAAATAATPAAPAPAAAVHTSGGTVALPGALPGAPGNPGLDGHTLAENMAAALAKTEDAADADIVAEAQDGGYRIGLVLGPGRPIRPRTASGMFTPPSPEDADITFVGVVLREPRTKRFLPAADVRVILEYEGGGEQQLDELTGPYPVYGKNLRLPAKGMRAISVVVGPPAYNRHAEMLAAYTGKGTARFEVREKPGKKAPNYEVVDPKKPEPVASDWKIGDDLREAAGEARAWTRDGEYAIGFIVEGPEPIWLWKGAQQAPQHCPVAKGDNSHVEVVVVHMPTGLNVTSAKTMVRFWRRTKRSLPPEQHDILLRPLLADFYHYGLTTNVPDGTWVTQVAVVPPSTPAWGSEPHPPTPEENLRAVFQYSRAPATAANGPAAEGNGFADRIVAAAATYGNGDRDGGKKELVDAFFAFEGSSLDNALRAADPGTYKSLETDWIAIRTKMESGADPADVKAATDAVAATLRRVGAEREAARAGGGAGGGAAGESAFVQSFLVLLREGFEAILVLALLVGVLKRTGKHEGIRLVYGGAGAAVGASLVLAAAATFLFRELGAAREAFEGFTLLASVLVLFVTSYWLVSRVEGRRWAAFVKNQIEGAATSGRRAAIATLAFLVVFREGAETVLFYAGLFSSAHGQVAAILGGIALAAVALAVLFWISVVGGARLPVRQFFAITGALLYLLAFKFAGDAFAELQSAGFVGATRVGWLPHSTALAAWLGIRPTLQTAIAQGVLVLAVLVGLAWTFLHKPRSPEAAGKEAAA